MKGVLSGAEGKTYVKSLRGQEDFMAERAWSRGGQEPEHGVCDTE